MATKPLPSQEVLRQLLDYDPETGSLRWKERSRYWFATDRSHSTWNARFVGKPALAAMDSSGYLVGWVLSQHCRAHRIIWKLQIGTDAVGVDHINGDRSDNRWVNLREAAPSENMKNMKRNASNTSGAMGVSYHKNRGKWHVSIRADGVVVHLGNYADYDEAVAVRKAAEVKHGFHRNHGRT